MSMQSMSMSVFSQAQEVEARYSKLFLNVCNENLSKMLSIMIFFLFVKWIITKFKQTCYNPKVFSECLLYSVDTKKVRKNGNLAP